MRASLSTALTQLENDTTASIEKLTAVLDSLHTGANTLQALLASVALMIERQVDRWARALAGAGLPKRDAWQDWVNEAKGFAKMIRETPATDPEDNLSQAESRGTTLIARLNQALSGQAADKTGHDALDGLLKAKRYSAAVDKVAELNPPPNRVASASEGVLKGHRDRFGIEGAEGDFDVLHFLPIGAPVPSLAYGFAVPPPGAVTPVSVLAAMAQRNVEVTGLLLSLIYASLIAAAGYFLFADKWVGIPLDFAVVFAWAFVTDIGADAATTAVKGLRKG